MRPHNYFWFPQEKYGELGGGEQIFVMVTMWLLFFRYLQMRRGRRGCDCMVVRITTTYAIKANHHWCDFESRSGQGIQHYVIKFVSDLRQVSVKHHQTNKNSFKNKVFSVAPSIHATHYGIITSNRKGMPCLHIGDMLGSSVGQAMGTFTCTS